MERVNRTLIITGGSLNIDFSRQWLIGQKFDTIITVDNGLSFAEHIGLYPDYLVGDFDSVDPELLERYKSEGKSTICCYPAEKDATDTQIAIELAIELGGSEIVLLGATGSRIDHMLANIHLLLICLKYEIPAYILEPKSKISLVNKTRYLKKNQVFGKFISLLPLSGTVKGVTLTGMKYPLTEAVLVPGDSIGISNEMVAEEGIIMVKDGILILFETMD